MPFYHVAFMGAIAATIAMTSPAHACAQEEVEHYEAHVPTTSQEAIKQYYTSVGAIGQILSNSNITDRELEAVHEESYTLEAAVEAFPKTGVSVKGMSVSALKEKIEALHLSSEEHQKEKTLSYYKAFSDAVITSR